MMERTQLLNPQRQTFRSKIGLLVRLLTTLAGFVVFALWSKAQSPSSTPSVCENLYLIEARESYSKLFPETEARTSQKILGVSLDLTKDEALYLNEMLGAKPPKEWISLPKTCKRALCALTHFLKSEESAMRVLTMAKKSGYFFWLKSEPTPLEPTPQTQVEIRHISRAVQKLPVEFQAIRGLKYIFRAPKGLVFNSNEFSNLGLSKRGVTFGKRSFTGFIYLFDKGIAGKNPTEIQSLTLTQIAAHVDMIPLESTQKRWSDSLNYLKALGWTPSRGIKNSAQGPIVFENWRSQSTFATTPSQEFSDGFSLFLIDPQSLKQKNPALMQFMQSEVFRTPPWLGIQSATDPADHPKILEACFSNIQKVTESRHGLEIEGKNGRKILRGKGTNSLSDNLDLAQLECLPRQPNQTLTTDTCDENNGNTNRAQEYLPVLNALGTVIDAIQPSTLDARRGTCFKNGLFTKACLLKEIKIPYFNDSKSQSLISELSMKLEISIFSLNLDDSLKWLIPYFPIKRFGHECLFSMIQSFRIENGEIFYQLNSDPNYRTELSHLKTCPSLDLRQLSIKTFESDDPQKISEILSSAATTQVVYETVLNTILNAGKRCQTFYSKKIGRDCLSEELKTDLAPLEKFEPWIGPFYQKLVTKYID